MVLCPALELTYTYVPPSIKSMLDLHVGLVNIKKPNSLTFFQTRNNTHKTWACGYTNNSVERFESPFICNLGCKRWHASVLRNKEISYNSNKKMFDFNLPEKLEVSQLRSLLICTLRSDFDSGRKVVLQTRIFFRLEKSSFKGAD